MRSSGSWSERGHAQQSLEAFEERLAHEPTETWADPSNLPSDLRVELLRLNKAADLLAVFVNRHSEIDRVVALEQSVAALTSLCEQSAKSHSFIMQELCELRREISELRKDASQIKQISGTQDATAALDGLISVIRHVRQSEGPSPDLSLDDVDPEVLDLLFPEREDDGK
jgi:hypothetical protein